MNLEEQEGVIVMSYNTAATDINVPLYGKYSATDCNVSNVPLNGKYMIDYVTTYNDHYHLSKRFACQTAARPATVGTEMPGLEKTARGAFLAGADEASHGSPSVGDTGTAFASPRRLVSPCTAATSTWRSLSARVDGKRFASFLPAGVPPGGMHRLPGGRLFPGGGRRKFKKDHGAPRLGVPTTFAAEDNRREYISGRHSPRSRHLSNPFMPLQRREMILREPVVLGELPGAEGYFEELEARFLRRELQSR